MSWTDALQLTRGEQQALIPVLTEALRQDRLIPGKTMSPSTRKQVESALAKLERGR